MGMPAINQSSTGTSFTAVPSPVRPDDGHAGRRPGQRGCDAHDRRAGPPRAPHSRSRSTRAAAGSRRRPITTAYIRQLIRQVLLTAPGERINRPDFGAGIRRIVFAQQPRGRRLAQTFVYQALSRWLPNLIKVEDIDVTSVESTMYDRRPLPRRAARRDPRASRGGGVLMAVGRALAAVRPDRADGDRLHPGRRAVRPDGAAGVFRRRAVVARHADVRRRAAAAAGRQPGPAATCSPRPRWGSRSSPTETGVEVGRHASVAARGRGPSGVRDGPRDRGRRARRFLDPPADHRRRRARQFLQRPRVQLQAGLPARCSIAATIAIPPPSNGVDYPVDYLARDFWSLRRALLDFAADRYPKWAERIEADQAVMLMEIMAALGDEFAYTAGPDRARAGARNRDPAPQPLGAGAARRLCARPGEASAIAWLVARCTRSGRARPGHFPSRRPSACRYTHRSKAMAPSRSKSGPAFDMRRDS